MNQAKQITEELASEASLDAKLAAFVKQAKARITNSVDAKTVEVEFEGRKYRIVEVT